MAYTIPKANNDILKKYAAMKQSGTTGMAGGINTATQTGAASSALAKYAASKQSSQTTATQAASSALAKYAASKQSSQTTATQATNPALTKYAASKGASYNPKPTAAPKTSEEIINQYRTQYTQKNNSAWAEKYKDADYAKSSADMKKRIDAMPGNTGEEKRLKLEAQAEYDWLEYNRLLNVDLDKAYAEVDKLDKQIEDLKKASKNAPGLSGDLMAQANLAPRSSDEKLSLGEVLKDIPSRVKSAKGFGEDYDKKLGELQQQRAALKLDTDNAKQLQLSSLYSEYTTDPAFETIAKQGAQMGKNKRVKKEDSGLYKFMDDDQKYMYDYLFARFGDESAERYFDNISQYLKMEKGLAQAERIEAIGDNVDDTLVGRVIGDTAQALVGTGYGVLAGIQGALTGKLGTFTGKEQDVTAKGYGASQVREDLGELGSGGFQKLTGSNFAQAMFDTATSLGNMAPSILLSTLTAGALGKAGVASAVAKTAGKWAARGSMFTGIYGNARDEMLRMGYNEASAKTYAALNATAEVGLESILGGFGAFGDGGIWSASMEKAVKNMDKAIFRYAATLGGKMGDEATEEYLQEILDPVFKNFALNEQNEVKPFTEEALYAAIVACMSVGLSSEHVEVIRDVDRNKWTGVYMNAVKDVNPELYDSFMQAAQNSENEDIKDLADGIVSGKYHASNGNLGQLAILMAQDGNQVVESVIRQTASDLADMNIAPYAEKAMSQAEREYNEMVAANPGFTVFSPIEQKLHDVSGWDAEKTQKQARILTNIFSGIIPTNTDLDTLDITDENIKQVFSEYTGIDMSGDLSEAELKSKYKQGAEAALKTEAYQDALKEANRRFIEQRSAQVLNSDYAKDVDAATEKAMRGTDLTVAGVKAQTKAARRGKTAEKVANTSNTNYNGVALNDHEGFIRDYMAKNNATRDQAEKAWSRVQAEAKAFGIKKEDTNGREQVRSGTEERVNDLGERGAVSEDTERGDRSEPTLDSGRGEGARRGLREGAGAVESSEKAAEVKVIPEAEYDERQTKLSNKLRADGFTTVEYVTGPLTNSKGVIVNAKVQGGKITLRWDNPRVSPERVADHERIHRWLDHFKSGKERSGFVRTKLLEIVEDVDTLNSLLDTYKKAYKASYADLSQQAFTDAVYEEILCDIYAGMDNYGVNAGEYLARGREVIGETGLRANAIKAFGMTSSLDFDANARYNVGENITEDEASNVRSETETTGRDDNRGRGTSVSEDRLGDGRESVDAVDERGELRSRVPRPVGVVRLSPDLQSAYSERGISPFELINNSNDHAAFSFALDEARNSDVKNGWAVTPKSAETLDEDNVTTFMHPEGGAGFGVTPDGDIVAVFKNKNSKLKKALVTMLPAAIENGGVKLDCYGGKLAAQYADFGFIPVASVEFNPKFANDGWTPDKGEPTIYFMMHNGDSPETVVKNYGKYHIPTQEELDALPHFGKDGYEDAMNLRDEELRKALGDTGADFERSSVASEEARYNRDKHDNGVFPHTELVNLEDSNVREWTGRLIKRVYSMDTTEFKQFHEIVDRLTRDLPEYGESDGPANVAAETLEITNGKGVKYRYEVELDGRMHGEILSKSKVQEQIKEIYSNGRTDTNLGGRIKNARKNSGGNQRNSRGASGRRGYAGYGGMAVESQGSQQAGDAERKASIDKVAGDLNATAKTSVATDQLLPNEPATDLAPADTDIIDETGQYSDVATERSSVADEPAFKEYNGRVLVSEDTLEQWLKDYAASNPNYAQAYVAYMTPRQFLKLTTEGVAERQHIQQQSEAMTEAEAQSRARMEPIFLRVDVETGEVLGHEGRHRMAALDRAGIRKVPVLLFDSNNKNSKAPLDEATFRGQFSPELAVVENLQPLSRGNADNVKKMFSEASSMERMGEKYGNRQTMRFSVASDEDYMAAVEAGDTKTAQQMVDGAAKAAGYTIKAYHGTKASFTTFRLPSDELGIHFGTRGQARMIAGRSKSSIVQNDVLGLNRPIRLDRDLGSWYPDYVTKELYRIGVLSKAEAEDILFTADRRYNRSSSAAVKDLRNILTSKGYDGIIYPNWYEGAKTQDSYLIWDIHKVKSAEPITYDSNGDVIPLSERFNEESNDIRFSVADDGDGRKLTDNEPVSDELKNDVLDMLRNADDPEALQNWVNGLIAENYELERKQKASPIIPTADTVTKISPDERKIERDQLDALIRRYGRIPEGENPARQVIIPAKVAEGRRVRQFLRTVEEAKAVPERTVEQVDRLILRNDVASYERISDKSAINSAERAFADRGYESVKREWEGISSVDHNPTKYDIALGEQLIIEAARQGDDDTLMKVIADVASMGTQAGQVVQAMSLLKKMGPTGQLYYIQKAVDRLNKQNEKRILSGKMPSVKINQDLARDVLTSEGQKQMDKAMDKLVQDIANQLPVTLMDKWNSWRYLAMLGNARTHIRNLLGNAVFKPVKDLKDLVAAAGESMFIHDPEQRTKQAGAFGKSRKYASLREFAANDFAEMEKLITGTGKYNPVNEIMEKRVIFHKKNGDPTLLEKYSNLNSNLLEKEDTIFLKDAYIRAMTSYLAARGIDPRRTDPAVMKDLNAARQYATKEAQKATYRDFSLLANKLNQLKKVPGAGILVEGLLPFTKTPINILKRGIEYSPIGLIKSLSYDAVKLRQGDITAAELIDHVAAGLTGTGVAMLGLVLANLGLARGGNGDDDDKKSQLEEAQGHQEYSLEIGNASYTIDWMAPVALPFFVGVEMQHVFGDGDKLTPVELANAMTLIMEPMLNLSMLDGISSTLDSVSYSQNNKLLALTSGMLTSYVSQGLPTLGGQFARTFDADRRMNYVDKNKDTPAWMQRFVQNAQGKIPGLASSKTAYVDIWGRKDTNSSVLWRGLENFLSPGYANRIKETPVDTELLRLYEATGNNAVLPSSIEKYFSVDSETLNLTADQYEQYATTRGQLSYSSMLNLITDEVYSVMSDEDKAVAIQKALDYAKQAAKLSIAPTYAATKWIQKAEEFDVSDAAIMYEALNDITGLKDEELMVNMTWLDDETLGKLNLSKFQNQSTITNYSQKGYEFKLDPAGQSRLWELYEEEYWGAYADLIYSREWMYANTQARAEMLNKLNSAVATAARKQLSNELNAAGYVSTAK